MATSARELAVEFVAGVAVTPVQFRLLAQSRGDLTLAWSAEAQAVAGLLPAMRTGAPLRIDGPLEAGFLGNLGTAQDILAMWVKDLGKVAIEATPLRSPRAAVSANRQALFFGGGVDSIFSLLRHAGSVTDLVYVHGFDVPLAETAVRRAVSAYLRNVADEFGINLVELETDLRALLDRHVGWRLSHGAALGAVAQLFAQHFSRIYVPSTYSYDKLQPCGSHPLLDPLWSSSSLQILHDGADTTRADKTATIARHAGARRWLRVCWAAPRAEQLNCCRCEKCLRTMVALQAAGELHVHEAFSLPLEHRAVRAIDLDPVTYGLWQENRALLARTGYDPLLLATVGRLLEPGPLRRLQQRIRLWNKQRRAVRRQRKQLTAGHDRA